MVITPSKAHIFSHWKSWLDQQNLDWGEPCCWACGKYWGTKYDLNKPHATIKEIATNWNKVKPLQKCHIIPKQFGGSDDVDNLFLMCIECHDNAPDTRSKDAFFKWINKQDYSINFKEKVRKEIKTFELEDQIESINELLEKGNLPKEVTENLGIHFNQTKGGPSISISTFFAAFYEYLNRDQV